MQPAAPVKRARAPIAGAWVELSGPPREGRPPEDPEYPFHDKSVRVTALSESWVTPDSGHMGITLRPLRWRAK